MPRIDFLTFAAPGLVLIGLPACTTPTAPEGIELMIQVQAVSGTPTLSGQAPAPGVQAIEIDEAVVVIGGLELDAADDGVTPDWALDESEVVPLRLDGEPTLAFRTNVPEGQYRGVGLSIDKLDPANPAEEPLINVFPRLENASLLVVGTLTRDGVTEGFAFKTALDTDVALPFDQPESFSSAPNSVKLYTLTLDLDRWFVRTTGGRLDPNDEADRAAIEESVAGSLTLTKPS